MEYVRRSMECIGPFNGFGYLMLLKFFLEFSFSCIVRSLIVLVLNIVDSNRWNARIRFVFFSSIHVISFIYISIIICGWIAHCTLQQSIWVFKLKNIYISIGKWNVTILSVSDWPIAAMAWDRLAIQPSLCI